MKKIKLLTSLAGLSALSMGLVPAIASCGCSSTGLQVEMVSKLKERTFNQKTGGSAWTFKLADSSETSNIKVKLTNLTVDGAETTPVAGLIKYSYDSAGNIKVTVKTNTLLTQWPNATKFAFSFLFTNKKTNQTTTLDGFVLDVDQTLEVVNFCGCDWSIITERADKLYAKTITEDAFFASFTIDGEIVITKWDDFIGLERSVTINNKKHIVRVADVNHDTIAAGQTYAGEKALFTFELVTLLSDNSGNALLSPWNNPETTNTDYLNCRFRKNINGKGDATLQWYDKDETALSETRTALDMLKEGNSDLFKGLKEVNKKIAINESKQAGEENFKLTDYSDILFPLTATEIVYNSESRISWCEGHPMSGEGTAYQYWILNSQKSTVDLRNAGRVKTDAYGTAQSWWLASPDVTSIYGPWYVAYTGIYIGTYSINKTGVSFGFCI